MGISLNILVLSGLSSLLLITLFSIEQHRGRRFGEHIRAIFDRMLTGMNKGVRAHMPHVNKYFFQELFHFIVQRTLSQALALLRRLEHLVLHVVRFNRMQVLALRKREAEVVAPQATDEHFAAIAEHKKAVELSPKEKQERKDASISGDGPF